MRQGTILVADDEERQREAMARALRALGHTVIVARGGAEAVAICRAQSVDVVLTDLRMPDVSGLEVLQQVRAIQPDLAVILVTAYGSVANAVAAMKAGAADYLLKPVELDELELLVDRILERRDLVRENKLLRRRLENSAAGFRLIGQARALQEVLARAARAAATDAGVLVLGESGTGKELLARSIHDLSQRASQSPFGMVCTPDDIASAMLFLCSEDGRYITNERVTVSGGGF